MAFAKLLNTTYGSRTYGILRHCAAEHGEGRALDWMINANNAEQLALANALTRWLAAPDAQGRPGAMAKRFGINYIIWNRQMWRAYDPGRGWAPYYGVSPHTDHIHFSFNWDGAYKRTSWWTGVAVTSPLTGPTDGDPTAPAPPGPRSITASGYPLLEQGATGADVALAQKVIGVTADGKFGPLTATALGTWQTKHGVHRDQEARQRDVVEDGHAQADPGRAPAHSSRSTSTSCSSAARPATAVKALQKAIGKLTVDGSYGPATESRVKEYQKAKGLTVTGITDSKVWNALMGDRGPGARADPVAAHRPLRQHDDHPLAKYSTLTLKLWSKGEAVKALQKAIGKLTVDGSYGRLTEARVKEYQKAKGLPVTGVTDAKVWKALMAPTPVSAPSTSTPATTSSALATEFTAYKTTTLKVGSNGAAVKVLQRGLGGLVVDGSFGSKTLAAVKAFQTSRKLSVTGVVDAKTWAALELKVHPLLPHWGTVLKRGSKGTAVVALQKALRITADGSFGPKTEAAVKALQKTAKLTQTGVVGTVTWKAVEARMPR